MVQSALRDAEILGFLPLEGDQKVNSWGAEPSSLDRAQRRVGQMLRMNLQVLTHRVWAAGRRNKELESQD
jgi:hypothetical protein